MKPEDLDSLVAANVRAHRARLKLRQLDLADDMGWAQGTVSAVEAGARRITLADAIALCEALQIDLRQLLAGIDPQVLGTLGLDRRTGS